MYEDNRRPSPTGNQYPLGYGPAGSGYSQYPRQESRWREQPSPVYQETIGAQQDQVQTQPPSWYPPQGFPEPPKSFKLPDGSKWVYKKKKRFLPLKITLAVIFMLIIAVVVAAAIFINGYINDFNSRVESHQSSVDTIQNSLTPAEAGKPYYILLLVTATIISASCPMFSLSFSRSQIPFRCNRHSEAPCAHDRNVPVVRQRWAQWKAYRFSFFFCMAVLCRWL